MRLPTQYNQRPPLRFNITPLIDVVFLLIIFFLVASHFVRSEQAEPVELPMATGGMDDNDEAPNRLTVTIAANGSLFVAGEPVTEQQVLDRIDLLNIDDNAAVPEVRFRGHKDGRFGQMRRLIEHCASRNIRSIRFAVKKPGQA